ncbi:Bacterial transcriptional activator domain protein [compost metagenome]
MMWFVHAKQVVNCQMQLGQYTEAMLLLQQLQERYPYVEDIYFGMMRIHAMHGNLGEVKRQYERLTFTMLQELGVGPSEALHTWYAQHFN